MTLVAVNLGSNFNAPYYLDQALQALSSLGSLSCSERYKSPAVGLQAAPFYNQALFFESDLDIQQLHNTFKDIEQKLGRHKFQTRPDVQPIDIDFLLYGQIICDMPPLPHPDILKHAHVLCPLSEILPSFEHPIAKNTLQTLWQGMQLLNPEIKKVAP